MKHCINLDFVVIDWSKSWNKNDDCSVRWNFKVVWQLLSMLDLCILLMSSWRSPSLIVLFVLGWRRFFESSWEHVIGQLPSTALHQIMISIMIYFGKWICQMFIILLCTLSGLLCSTKSVIGQVRGICSRTWQGGLPTDDCFCSRTLNFAFIFECWHSLLRLIPCLQLPSVQGGSWEGGWGGGSGW